MGGQRTGDGIEATLPARAKVVLSMPHKMIRRRLRRRLDESSTYPAMHEAWGLYVRLRGNTTRLHLLSLIRQDGMRMYHFDSIARLFERVPWP